MVFLKINSNFSGRAGKAETKAGSFKFSVTYCTAASEMSVPIACQLFCFAAYKKGPYAQPMSNILFSVLKILYVLFL